jgi:hypothetical protein
VCTSSKTDTLLIQGKQEYPQNIWVYLVQSLEKKYDSSTNTNYSATAHAASEDADLRNMILSGCRPRIESCSSSAHSNVNTITLFRLTCCTMPKRSTGTNTQEHRVSQHSPVSKWISYVLQCRISIPDGRMNAFRRYRGSYPGGKMDGARCGVLHPLHPTSPRCDPSSTRTNLPQHSISWNSAVIIAISYVLLKTYWGVEV